MSSRNNRSPFDEKAIIFELEGRESTISSGKLPRSSEELEAIRIHADLAVEQLANDEKAIELSPVMKELAAAELPQLERENRAWLQMQTPNRLFLYWSLKNDPYRVLNRAFSGNTGSYTLVVKLIDLSRDTEEIHPIEQEGSWWFSVDADSSYQAEIGFFATNRRFVRIMFSNVVETPRKRPSARTATAADWNISSNKFAQVLDVAGFKQDAFEVALSGDQALEFDREAFARFVESEPSDFAGVTSEELRYALLLIASGLSIEHLRYRIDASLFALLEASAAKLNADNALTVLREQFGVEGEEILEEEQDSAVYGSSIVNFPRRLKRRISLPRGGEYKPISSPGR